MDTPNTDAQLKNEENSESQGFQHDVNDFVNAAPEYTRNYGRTLGNPLPVKRACRKEILIVTMFLNR